MTDPARPKQRRADLGLTAAVCVVFVATMVGAAFAAVPLYRIFCQVTGYNGTVRQAAAAPATMSSREVTVSFDANIGNSLGWNFRPSERSLKVKLGEVAHTTFFAENLTNQTVTATATFNVTPGDVGLYFNKLDCFCFSYQTLKPGEKAELGVTFFIDPAMANDEDLDTTSSVTLSYTFFPVANPAPKPIASATVVAPANQL